MKNKKANFICPIVAFVLFIVCTLWIKFFDVQPVGPNGSNIGCASLNMMLLHSQNEFWYNLTEYIGYLALVVMLAMACLGLYQLIKGKGFKAVGLNLYVLAGFYALMIGFYVLFEIIIINYRPVLEDGKLEASFPSSHTILSLCVMLSLVYQLKYFIKKKTLRDCITIFAIVFALLAVVGRFLCGVHWFTDILGGVVLSCALLLLYDNVMKIVDNKIAQ